ncbi:hypothetical protein EV421DRAFT_1732624 [Armillaria borealis]|uniref:Uncharacterized protein n=1 Tax=Armillaria borealis TaxID=47425 RepID=A0AA39JVI2_9AGAR|nr:hypothetical protein EV421DRAFT_1732624 [Armillaria borealis]
MPQASTSILSSSTGPASTFPISPLSSNSTSGAASSSTAPESSSQVLLLSTHIETTAPGTTSREQTSGSSCQASQPQEDITTDEPDEYGFDNATLNNASLKELLKICAQLLQAAVSSKVQVRKEDVRRKYPSKKTLVRMDMTTLEKFVTYKPADETFMMEITDMVQAKLLKEDHLVNVNAYVKETLQNHLLAAHQKWAEAISCLKKDTLEFKTELEVVNHVVETGHHT